MAVSAGGLETLVFTAGIGENSASIRAAVCDRLAPLGVALDLDLNAGATADCEVSRAGSRTRTLVIHAREELVAARLARGVLA